MKLLWAALFSGSFLFGLLFAQSGGSGLPTNCDEHGDMSGAEMGCAVPSNVHRQTGEPKTQREGVLAPRAIAPVNHAFIGARGIDDVRSGTNTHETTVTLANVGRMHKLFSHVLPADPRLEAQPLIVPHVKLADGETANLAIYATMSNAVFGCDADSPRCFWETSLGHPISGTRQIDGWGINMPGWGIVSTPVIDPETNRLYAVTWSETNGDWAKGVFKIHTLDIASGHEIAACPLQGITYNPGDGLPVQQFDASERKQRGSLAFANIPGHKTVFIPFGTILELDRQNRGWIVAYDVQSNSVSAAWCDEVNWGGGGIWSAGAAPVVQVNPGTPISASLFFMTGNGPFDAKHHWGESFIHLKYFPKQTVAETQATGMSAGFQVADWWTPYSDSSRVGDPQTDIRITSVKNCCGYDDIDLGSSGVTLVGNHLIGAGKDGIAYVLDVNNMGKTQPGDFANPAANYAKAKWIGWFSYPSGMDIARAKSAGIAYPQPADAKPRNFIDLNKWSTFLSATHHVHSTPVWFTDAMGDQKIYVWGENGNLRAYEARKDGTLQFLANGAEVASAQSQSGNGRYGGMPGAEMTISANGTRDAILWATVPLEDANKQVSQGYVAAYDANNLGQTYSDGTHKIVLVWKSPLYTYYSKFDPPIVSGGKLYVPTYDGRVDAYGVQ